MDYYDLNNSNNNVKCQKKRGLSMVISLLLLRWGGDWFFAAALLLYSTSYHYYESEWRMKGGRREGLLLFLSGARPHPSPSLKFLMLSVHGTLEDRHYYFSIWVGSSFWYNQVQSIYYYLSFIIYCYYYYYFNLLLAHFCLFQYQL